MKKVLTVVLSLAVLFSFAACENQVPTLYGAKVLSVTPVSSLDYITGETVNPADIQFRIVYDSKAEATLSGAEIGMAPASDNSNGYAVVNAGEDQPNKFVVTYGIDDKGQAQKWPVNIIGNYVDSLIVDPTNAVDAVLMNDSHEVPTTGLSYTAVFAGGTKAIDSTLAESKLGGSTFTYPSTASADDEVKVSWTQGTSGVKSVKISPDWTVTLTDEDPSKVVSEVILVQNSGKKVFAVTGTGATNNTLGDVDFSVFLKYEDGHIGDSPLDKGESAGNYSIDFPRYALTYELASSNVRSFPAKVTIHGTTDADDKVYDTTLNVAVTDDYATKYSVSYNGSAVNPGDEIPVTLYTFTATEWASKKSDYTPTQNQLRQDEFTVSPRYVKIGYEGTTMAVSFTYTVNPDATTSTSSTVNVNQQSADSGDSSSN